MLSVEGGKTRSGSKQQQSIRPLRNHPDIIVRQSVLYLPVLLLILGKLERRRCLRPYPACKYPHNYAEKNRQTQSLSTPKLARDRDQTYASRKTHFRRDVRVTLPSNGMESPDQYLD
jgi:hypothetical protein